MSLRKSIVGAARLPGLAWSFSRLGFERRADDFAAKELDVSLAGKTCLVTGANQGIGFAIARGLAERDADVMLLCRDRARGSAAAETLSKVGSGRVSLELVDISELGSVRSLLERLELPAVDVLVHNAGALFSVQRETSEGLERTAAVHVFGPDVLTRGLLEPLRERRGRVITVSSGGMYSERLDVTDMLEPPLPFDGVRAYALAKRAQVVLGQEWAAREQAVDFYVMHPGWVDTVGVANGLPRFYRLTKPFLRTIEQGADSALWLATAVDLPIDRGAFVFDRAEARRHLLPGTRAHPSERERLWALLDAQAQAMWLEA